MKDAHGDRMKYYESFHSGARFMPQLPVVVRLDGVGFSKWTKGLEYPYDKRFRELMADLTAHMVQETGAVLGYTQSDEITLILWAEDYTSQIYHDRRIQKIVSSMARLSANWINRHVAEYLPEKADTWPGFDVKADQYPSIEEVANNVVWRFKDARRNSISMAAQAEFSHKQLQGKSQKDMLAMLSDIGVDWENDYPDAFRHGIFVQRRKRKRKFTTAELEKLPEKHAARRDPNLVVERTDVVRLNMPPFTEVQNREAVIFEGADPLVAVATP